MMCSICLDDEYDLNDKSSYITSCHHQFHLKCISVWYRSSIRCPCCRTKSTFCVPVAFEPIITISDIDYTYIMNVIHNYAIKIDDFHFIMNIMRNNNHSITHIDYNYIIKILNEVINMYNRYANNIEFSYSEYSENPKYYDYTSGEYRKGMFSTVNTLFNNNNNNNRA